MQPSQQPKISVSPEERRRMAEVLLPLDPALEATIERRVEEMRTGKVQGIPAAEAIRRLRDLVR